MLTFCCVLCWVMLEWTYPNNEVNVVLSACVGHVSSSAHRRVSKAGEEDCCGGPHPSHHCLQRRQTRLTHQRGGGVVEGRGREGCGEAWVGGGGGHCSCYSNTTNFQATGKTVSTRQWCDLPCADCPTTVGRRVASQQGEQPQQCLGSPTTVHDLAGSETVHSRRSLGEGHNHHSTVRMIAAVRESSVQQKAKQRFTSGLAVSMHCCHPCLGKHQKYGTQHSDFCY